MSDREIGTTRLIDAPPERICASSFSTSRPRSSK